MTIKICKNCNAIAETMGNTTYMMEFPISACVHDWQAPEQPKFSPEQLEQIKKTCVTEENYWGPRIEEEPEQPHEIFV